MSAEILAPEEWGLVEPIVTGVHGNAMPVTPKQAVFVTLRDGDRLRGFTHVEVVLHVASMYVAPEDRGGRTVWHLIQATDALMQAAMPGFSAIVFPEAESHGKLYQRMGGRNLGEVTLWRKDY